MALYLADNDQYEAELEQLPKYDGEGDEYCEGNVAKFCKSDDSKTWYRASYDCTLPGATCVEQPHESGKQWANCQAPRLKCEGEHMSYCDGTRAVVCEGIGSDILSPWVYDCADAFGSHCVNPAESDMACEGPEVGEHDCHDGDGDGKVDCMDRDCGCVEKQCDDGVDDDGDGKVDCDDENCLHPPLARDRPRAQNRPVTLDRGPGLRAKMARSDFQHRVSAWSQKIPKDPHRSCGSTMLNSA